MKKRILFIIVPVVVTCLAFSCCFFYSSEKEQADGVEPEYKPDIVWTLETQALETWADMKLIGQYIYLIESNYLGTIYSKRYLQLTKVNAETGEYVWKSEIINKPEKTCAVKINGYVFIQSDPGYVLCFDDNNGSLLATIKLGSDDKAAERNSAVLHDMISYGNYLFWGNSGYDNSGGVDPLGLMRFDITAIDFSKEPHSEQVILPQLVWEAPIRHPVWPVPVENNGIIYFMTMNTEYPLEGTGDIVAMDAVTCEVKWKYNQNIMKGLAPFSLVINEEKLYVIDSSLGCYNINTGEKYFEIIASEQDYTKDYCLDSSSFLRGIFFYDDKLYYTTQGSWATPGMTDIPANLVKNILCVDASDGEYVWGDIPEGGGSLGTRPIVVNGRAYVVSDMGLRVYDADSGRLIGVDKTVKNYGRQANALYNNYVIYLNDNFENKTATLTAIKAE